MCHVELREDTWCRRLFFQQGATVADVVQDIEGFKAQYSAIGLGELRDVVLTHTGTKLDLTSPLPDDPKVILGFNFHPKVCVCYLSEEALEQIPAESKVGYV